MGSIYNYFKSKEALMSATVESVWCEIFHEPEDGSVFEDTLACISWMYGRMEYGQRKYPGFFTLHSLGFLGNAKPEGRQRMQETWKHISDGLIFVLKVRIFVPGSGRTLSQSSFQAAAVCRCPVFPDAVSAAASG